MRLAWVCLAVISAPLLVSCVSPITLAPVGPRPLAWHRALAAPGQGQLQVFSETDEYAYGHDVPFFPHRDYQLYTDDGKHLKRVWNSQNYEDETPATVDLPSGRYLVKADAEFCGPVFVPVVIKAGQLTRVILQPGWKPSGSFAQTDLVQSPSGYFIGWRAEPPKAQ